MNQKCIKEVTLEYFEPESGSVPISSCPECQSTSRIVKYGNSRMINKFSFALHGRYRSNRSIPKSITTVDQQYLTHCLKLVQITATKEASVNISVTSCTTKTFASPENISILGSLPDGSLFSHDRANGIHSIKSLSDSYHHGSTGELSVLGKPENESTYRYISSIFSTSSDSFRGILRSTWSNGVPHFMFYIVNSSENVFVTTPSKCPTYDQNIHEWTYLIHIRNTNGEGSDLVGRMNVSARYTISADGLNIINTESVLYGNIKLQEDEDNSNDTKCINLLQKNIASNFELAAIIFKEQVQPLQMDEMKVSGWGMSFLNRAKEKQPTLCPPSILEASMDVLIPSGYHGEPNTRTTGPSSLIERWRSDGKCDCGGWDIGCPITILKAKPSKDYNKSLNIFPTGDDDQGLVPLMKMMNVQKGIYCIEFQPRLSALQCFSIAVAVIHGRSPSLRPED